MLDLALPALNLPRKTSAQRRQTFESVYADSVWGAGGADQFYSGVGSDGDMLEPYARVVRALLEEKQIRAVVDVGCGDYRVGGAIRTAGTDYIGVDIVPALIERNRRLFGDAKTQFVCLDAVVAPLPDGDLCILKQVLQHLSNAEIARILSRTKKFRYLLVTEFWPASSPSFRPNRDKPTDASTRGYLGSGVYPHLPPFSYGTPQIRLEMPVNTIDTAPGEQLITMLFENGDSKDP
ncbi:MAG TPA: class I SAM-dependent methyltransferase [Terriglobales bacterium]|nr:class I SAM-dependent methyltransferase [Terriglobales bacterium]